MLESLYYRSMSTEGDSQAIKILVVVLIVIMCLLVVLLAIPVDQVIRTKGITLPISVIPISAKESSWIKLNKNLLGTQIQANEEIGNIQFHQNVDEIEHEIIQLKRKLTLLTLEKAQTDIENQTRILTKSPSGQPTTRYSFPQQKKQALDQKIAMVKKDIAYKEQRLKTKVLKVEKAGQVFDVKTGYDEYTWINKGDTILSLFDPDKLIVRASIPNYKSNDIDKVTNVILENKKTNKRIEGTIERFFFQEADSKYQMMVDIKIDSSMLFKPGQSLEVNIITTQKPLITILRETFI